MQSVQEFCESLMSFIYSHPESLCIVSLSDAKRELPQWMEYLGSEFVSTNLDNVMDILKDKDRYGGKASLYVEARDIPFPIPFINYGNVDVDRLKENGTELNT